MIESLYPSPALLMLGNVSLTLSASPYILVPRISDTVHIKKDTDPVIERVQFQKLLKFLRLLVIHVDQSIQDDKLSTIRQNLYFFSFFISYQSC